MDKEQLSQFYKENKNLVHFAVTKEIGRFSWMYGNSNANVCHEELFAQLSEVFLKACKSWNPEESKFSTYFMTSAHNHVSYMLTRASKNVPFTDYTMDIAIRKAPEDAIYMTEDIFEDQENDQLAQFELAISLKAAVSNASPMAQRVLGYIINPPDWIKAEADAKHCKSMMSVEGKNAANRTPEINLRFVCGLMLKSYEGNVEAKSFIRQAQREVSDLIRKVAS